MLPRMFLVVRMIRVRSPLRVVGLRVLLRMFLVARMIRGGRSLLRGVVLVGLLRRFQVVRMLHGLNLPLTDHDQILLSHHTSPPSLHHNYPPLVATLSAIQPVLHHSHHGLLLPEAVVTLLLLPLNSVLAILPLCA